VKDKIIKVKREKDISVQILIDTSQLKTEYADLVNFEVFNGRVIFNFLQTYPNTMPLPPGADESSQPERMAKIASRVSLPWDHFVRIIPAMIDVAQNNCDSASEAFNEALKIIEEIGNKQP